MTPLARMIGGAFAPLPEMVAPVALPPNLSAPVPATCRRRKRLWELPHNCHCPLVGTSLPMTDLRRIARKLGPAQLSANESEFSDYTLHTLAVGQCSERSPLAEAIQRELDRRYAAVISRFGKARGETAVLELWREALLRGEVAGALWAAWSHPDLGEDGGKTIYGDIHMLSHQVGSAARADLQRLAALEQQNAQLRDEAAALRIGLSSAQSEKDRVSRRLTRQLAETEQALAERTAAQDAGRDELAMARRALRDANELRDRLAASERRAERLERERDVLQGRVDALEERLPEMGRELAAAEKALEAALCSGIEGESGCGRACPAEAALEGRCVLCIGGRTGSVDGYRRLVETQGGRFLHHDGGQEESLHRIDAAIAAADAVVCQSGCVSHAAYWRLKEACKKQGKPCVFLKSPGVGSFARGLEAFTGVLN